MFTDEEVKIAKAVRNEIILGGESDLKSIYMAGEIVMWDQMRSGLSSQPQEDKWISVEHSENNARKAFQAGRELGSTEAYFNSTDRVRREELEALMDEDEFIQSLKPSPPKVASIKEKGENG